MVLGRGFWKLECWKMHESTFQTSGCEFYYPCSSVNIIFGQLLWLLGREKSNFDSLWDWLNQDMREKHAGKQCNTDTNAQHNCAGGEGCRASNRQTAKKFTSPPLCLDCGSVALRHVRCVCVVFFGRLRETEGHIAAWGRLMNVSHLFWAGGRLDGGTTKSGRVVISELSGLRAAADEWIRAGESGGHGALG